MASRKTPASPKTTTAGRGDTEDSGQFSAGTGSLAEDMASSGEQVAEQAAAIRGRVMRVQKLDADGAPVGEPYTPGSGVAGLEFKPDDSGISLEFEKAFDAASESEGVENPQVASVPTGNMVEFEISDPTAVELLRRLTRIPIPTAVVAQWFPAYFRPEPGAEPWATCKVFLTPQGLYVYRTAPEQPETFESGATPTWYAGVDFEATAKPVTGYAAHNAGIPIITSAGRVNVQPYGGCGCSARKLKNWTPTWARTRISWNDAVKLAADATAGR